MRLLLLVAAFLLLEAGVLAYTAEYGGAPKAFADGQRYLFVPFTLYVWTLISAWSWDPKPRRWPFLGVGLLFLCMGYQSSRQYTATVHPAADWPAVCRELRSGRPVEIQVAPYATKMTITADGSASP